MIWALAGLGADYSTYNAGYTPAQRDAPVRPTTLVERTGTPTFKIPENAYVPPVEVPQQTETPWALVGLVVLGLGVAYASYKSDEARFEPNRKGHIRRKVASWAKGRVNVIIAERGMGSSKGDERRAYGALKSVGAKNVKIDRPRGRGRSRWIVGGWVKKSELRSLRSKLKPRMLRMMRVQ